MSPEPYDVGPEQLREIFDEYIKDLVFGDAQPAPPGQRPVMVQLGGQLAAGKSHALKGVINRHQGRVALVSPDDFRAYHPRYSEIMRERPQEMMALTAQAMYAWSDMVREHAHLHGLGIVTESTFRRTEDLLGYSAEMADPVPGRHPGFATEVVVVATPGDRSCLDMVGRYLADPPGQGRWADVEGHDSSYDQLPITVDALEGSPHVHRVIVTDRSGAIHYDNSRGADGRWGQEARGGQALRDVRGEGRVPFSQEEASAWVSSYWKHAEKLITREELGPRTTPTMLSLHERADRVAQVAYAGDPERLAQHKEWQQVQKAVFVAAGRGASNSDLPRHPEEFLNADEAKKTRFMATMRAAGHSPPNMTTGSEEAVRLAQQGMAPPTSRPSPSSGPSAPPGRHHGRGKGPDIER
ncbi:zeta toxin family protein [Nocardiopsis changdeensis]|uniref:UDP-N-acetylglucosamine kinase n=1 Tax=Nocardiopsis changdeensis TaxID=2831969 RepID=A0ABX8BSZ0_9ACTN|nr:MULTISPECIES: zeta toxin family protein [Nocardiopsis]QUX23498.1 zeta toxin family protein [Nocardiopsis changdeensis]QYX39442.1 zeta toxin family protein [Nocardiopsis sp. MT53]